MVNVGSISTGERLGTNYSARHTEGLGLIPLGDRDRVHVNEIHLVGTAEEVDSVDRYSKYSNEIHLPD